MDDRLYYIFMTLLLSFQTQFTNIMDNRSGRRTAGLNEHGNLLEGILQAEDFQDLFELTEIEQQSFALEEDLRRAMTEISRSPRSPSRWRRDLRILQQQLENLQAQLRAKTETIQKSIQQHQRRISFSKISMLKHQKQLEDQERRGRFSRSCPNIPSELYDSDIDLIKCMSMNESLDFREGPEDIRKMLLNDKVCKLLDTFNHSMKIKKKTSVLHNSSFPLDPSQQGPMRETDHPHWNQTYSRSLNSTDGDTIRRSSAPEQPDHESDIQRDISSLRAQHNNAIRTTTNQTRPSQDDDGIRRSSAPEQPDHESDRPRDVSSLIAQHMNAIRTATNQTRPSQTGNGIRRSASSAQLDCDSNSARVKKAKQDKVPITVEPVVKSCGSPSFSETNICTAIYKTMTAICATIFMAIYF